MLLLPEGPPDEWVATLPAKGSPAWLGLSVTAEKMLAIKAGNTALQTLLSLFAIGGGSAGGGKIGVKGGKLWLQALAPKFQGFAESPVDGHDLPSFQAQAARQRSASTCVVRAPYKPLSLLVCARSLCAAFRISFKAPSIFLLHSRLDSTEVSK